MSIPQNSTRKVEIERLVNEINISETLDVGKMWQREDYNDSESRDGNLKAFHISGVRRN